MVLTQWNVLDAIRCSTTCTVTTLIWQMIFAACTKNATNVVKIIEQRERIKMNMEICVLFTTNTKPKYNSFSVFCYSFNLLSSVILASHIIAQGIGAMFNQLNQKTRNTILSFSILSVQLICQCWKAWTMRNRQAVSILSTVWVQYCFAANTQKTLIWRTFTRTFLLIAIASAAQKPCLKGEWSLG